MELKNKEIKKLFDYVAPYFDLFSLPSVMTEFMACDEAIERGNELRKANNKISDLEEQLAQAKQRLTLLETSIAGWRSRAQHAEKRVMYLNEKVSDLEKELAEARNSTELNLRKENKRLRGVIDERDYEIHELEKKIQDLEEENASLRATPADTIRIKSLERANKILRRENGTLWSRLEEADLNISKRPWHGDANAMTGARTWSEMLAETIEFQNKKIEELEAEKARLKEAYDIHETTIKKENVDLSPGHEFEFGDEVFVPWSCDPYMYIKSGMMYNPRTERLVYVGKDQHLKWFGEKF